MSAKRFPQPQLVQTILDTLAESPAPCLDPLAVAVHVIGSYWAHVWRDFGYCEMPDVASFCWSLTTDEYGCWEIATPCDEDPRYRWFNEIDSGGDTFDFPTKSGQLPHLINGRLPSGWYVSWDETHFGLKYRLRDGDDL